MVNKSVVVLLQLPNGGSNLDFQSAYYDGNTIVEGYGSTINISSLTTEDQIRAAIKADILAYAVTQGYSGLTSDSIIMGVLSTGIGAVRSFANPSRSLNSGFQISTTRDAQVSYSVDVACTATLLGGQTGTVYLEYADDSGFTTNVKEVARQVNGNSVSLAVAITANQNITATVGGIIPAGKYVRLRTQNNTGSPSFTFRASQEVLL